MQDRWFSTIRLRLTTGQFRRLPRNPAYKYEHIDKTAWLTPRPKSYHGRLELGPRPAPTVVDADEPVHLRPLVEADWEGLPKLFAGSFHNVQPFASLSEKKRVEAARSCLDYTRADGDGPVIEPACWLAVAQDEVGERAVGAVLVTLLPDGDLEGVFSSRWPEPPPSDCIARRLGQPHLTWIFVGPWHARHGVGSALLDAAVGSLWDLGYCHLVSSFLLGNESSMLWHWRNGFRLLAYPGSPRRMRERIAHDDRAPQGSAQPQS